ncbi:hypothetical protein STRDD10_00915 [Streptococcus sp. DD10]|uniref:DUF6287 domain-containing protein n=1 Tax=Streptococcus sp. DD10 TaxID=1777878 RepID=UPI0007976404|nr:DUF6287 domain-containing protein [Streptococcus sp. DD10]KXT74456.1 hypothetical protein STRDD10_00915 [Streptococcus sp. DD10]
MKKFVNLLLFTITALTLTACSTQQEKTQTSSSRTQASTSKDTGQDSQSTSSDSQATSSESKFQVKVSVDNLCIRKEPSTTAQENGMAAQGIYTIIEIVFADDYTWGKLESGQGWIALEFTSRLDGTTTTSSSGEMNLQDIVSGDFSSVSGTWRNAKGEVLIFDKHGLLSDDFILGKFSIKDGYLGTGVSFTNTPVGGELLLSIL